MPHHRATTAGVDVVSNLHEPFLQRAATASTDQSGSGHALGAFLTLRLVDQFFGALYDGHADALAYQTQATRDFLRELHPHTVETNHLLEIVRVADGVRASGSVRLMFPPLLAFAYWLEQELRLDESLDVLAATLQLSSGVEGEEEVSANLQRGRVLRLLGRFREATDAYAWGGQVASRLGDRHSELLSRIGRAIVLQKTGNLPESERVLRQVRAEAKQSGDRDAEARACHDLAVALRHMNRGDEAAPLAFRAYQLYEQPIQRMRALSDTGEILKAMGHYGAAKDAFLSVMRSEPPAEIRLRTGVELLELSALLQDRVSFERWRRDVGAHYHRLPADELVAYELKLGMGLASFEQEAEGKRHIERAMVLAEQSGQGQWVFRAEAALEEMQQRRTECVPRAAPVAEPELRTTIESLRALYAGA